MKILNLAHRGFSGKYPENTRRAFIAAIEEGHSQGRQCDGGHCDGFESDVHLSADGEPVIIHDDLLERTTDGKGAVGDWSFAELRKLDCGAWKGREFAGERIMHLDELLELVIEKNIVLNLEIKNYSVFYKGIEEKVIGRIKALGAQNRVFLSSFNHISMGICKEIDKTIEAGLLYGYPLLDMDDYGWRHGMDALHPQVNCLEYTPELVEKAHNKGLKINTWTANTEEQIEFCIKIGVDSIISNYPDKVAEFLAEKNS
jgi:glycerophosphoryl diester phosphodiesterase